MTVRVRAAVVGMDDEFEVFALLADLLDELDILVADLDADVDVVLALADADVEDRLRDARRRAPRAPLVAILAWSDDAMIRRALRAGADAIYSLDASTSILKSALVPLLVQSLEARRPVT